MAALSSLPADDLVCFLSKRTRLSLLRNGFYGANYGTSRFCRSASICERRLWHLEQFDTPVMMRSTVRISHTKTPVEVGERTEVAKRPYEKDCAKWVMMPAFAKPRRKVLVERIGKIREWVETCPTIRSRETPPRIEQKGWNHLRRSGLSAC